MKPSAAILIPVLAACLRVAHATGPRIIGEHPTIIRPARGQSLPRQQLDQYQCFIFAEKKSGFDPSGLAVNPPPPNSPEAAVANRELLAFNDAQKSCLVKRGYDVSTVP